MCQVRLPTTAVALELLLRYEESGIISLDHCKRLAIDCNIDPETDTTCSVAATPFHRQPTIDIPS